MVEGEGAPPRPGGLSVVVVPFDGIGGLRRCLAGLSRQTVPEPREVIVPYDARRRWSVELAAEFPEVRFLRLRGRRSPAELRAAGVRCARMPIVAVTEDHCVPRAGWMDRILEAHRLPHAAIGGTIEKRTPDTVVPWALYLLDYLRYAGPREPGATHALSDVNVAYKRVTLDRVVSAWSEAFHEPTVHVALTSEGEQLWLDPDVVVYEARNLTLAEAIRDRLAFGRLFGANRAQRASLAGRVLRVLLCPGLPLLLAIRTIRGVGARPRFRRPAIVALPTLLLLAAAWSTGEAVGYVTGRAGRSLRLGEHP